MSRRVRAPARARRRLAAPRHYAVARHRETGLIWAFAIVSDVLVGVCGPLDAVPPTRLLPHLCFDDPWARLDVPVIRSRLDEFDRLD
jgi:hypothetical protein